MANLGRAFNPSEYSDTFTLLDPGIYKVAVTSSKGKGDGRNELVIILTFTVLEGKDTGVTMNQSYTFISPKTGKEKESAENTGMTIFARVCKACGIKNTQVHDSAQIHNIPIMIEVEDAPWTGRDGKQMEGRKIKRYWQVPKETVRQPPVQPSMPQPTPTPSPAVQPGAMPERPSWMSESNQKPPF